ncbi:hypothetical protein AB1E22_05280 [Buttiauxella gaviniae]|uniref:DUF1240 domain-containing protein n=1 Tax=Buttiauxella gaviniae TaxID=82990 RepID=A0ABV3NRH7_9ENTR
MKINSQWLAFKGANLFSIILSAGIIYFTIYGYPLNYLRSLLMHEDIIKYGGGAGLVVSSIPLFIYIFFLSLLSLLKKGSAPLNTKSIIHTIWIAFSVFTFAIGFISLYIIPIFLTASSYIPCREEHLIRYYVTDPRLCETLPIKLDKRKWIGLSKFSSSPHPMR